jgi:hypothetical protein
MTPATGPDNLTAPFAYHAYYSVEIFSRLGWPVDVTPSFPALPPAG